MALAIRISVYQPKNGGKLGEHFSLNLKPKEDGFTIHFRRCKTSNAQMKLFICERKNIMHLIIKVN